MSVIIMSNGGTAHCDSETYRKYTGKTFFFSHGQARFRDVGHPDNLLTLAQLVLGAPKGSKVYFIDGNKLNCVPENLSLEDPNKNLGGKVGRIKVKIPNSDKTYKGIEYRKYPHRYARVATPAWYAVYKAYDREAIAGPFRTPETAALAYNYCSGTEVNPVDKFVPRGGKQLEAVIQEDIVQFLTLRGWLVHVTHMNMMEKGWPDLNCLHPKYGPRFVDVKRPQVGQCTKAQKEFWPMMHQFGSGPHIMTAATEFEYKKLFGPPNYADYLPATGECRELKNVNKYETPLYKDAKMRKI